MKVQIKTTPAAGEAADAILFFLHSEQKPSVLSPAFKSLAPEEFAGKPGQICVVHTQGKLPAPRAVLIGLGKRKDLTPPKLHRAAIIATRHLRKIGVKRAAIDAGTADYAGIITEAALMAHYDFDLFKPSEAPPKTKLERITLHVTADDLSVAKQSVQRSQIVAETVNWTKSIANLPGNILYPAKLADEAVALARASRGRLRCRVFDKRALQKGGFGGLLGVGDGSAREPRLIVLEYRGGRAKQKPLALVGKAITFDSGGISIKPADKMEEMKWDKCGGVAVMGILRAAAALKLPLNITGIIASAENMPSATSYRPGDILTTRGGKTIEVINTDAEGRVILADALAYACEQKPITIVDFATLTGACCVALGTEIAGVMGNDAGLIKRIKQAAEAVGEPVWELPLTDDFRNMVKSDAATVKNSAGRYGGACSAAAFLQAFVDENIPWAHVDIAGPAWVASAKPHHEKGATAFGVRLILEMITR